MRKYSFWYNKICIIFILFSCRGQAGVNFCLQEIISAYKRSWQLRLFFIVIILHTYTHIAPIFSFSLLLSYNYAHLTNSLFTLFRSLFSHFSLFTSSRLHSLFLLFISFTSHFFALSHSLFSSLYSRLSFTSLLFQFS